MTLKRKILILIFFLIILIILAMSGVYYRLFSQQIQEYSHNQVRLAVDLFFDDMSTQAKDSLEKIDRFVYSSLTGPMYVAQLLQEQFAELEDEWSIRSIRKICSQLSTLAYETGKFGELIDAAEIVLYDADNTLLAFYAQNGEQRIQGIFLQKVLEDELIVMTPGDDWYALLQSVEDIPRAPLPEEVSITYQGEPSETPYVEFNAIQDKLMLTFVVPIIESGSLQGTCLMYIPIRKNHVQQYARLSQTEINIFVGSTFSIGTLEGYKEVSEELLISPHTIDLLDYQEAPTPSFSEMESDGQQYYQGTVALGEKKEPIGAITAHFPRSIEEQRRNEFLTLLLVITLVFTVITAGGASILSAIIVKPIKLLTGALQKLTRGELNELDEGPRQRTDKLSSMGSDEINLLFQSFHAMVSYLREMANIANHISRGEIAQAITPRSENDVLGTAFHRMTAYLKEIAEIANAVAQGDLRQDMQPMTDEDVLGKAFHSMTTLRQTMGNIMRQAEQLHTTSSELNQISAQMVADANQSSQRAQDVSSSSQQVSQSVNEVATATRQMAASIREISKHANDVAQVVHTAVSTAESTNTTISNLESRSQEIGNIIKVITAITQQTNLLALNATIEAARAGESGKGFAVVASEVKDLAREITKSAGDITQKVEAIQISSKDATEAISEMSKNIEQVHLFTNVVVASVTEQATTTEVINRNLADAANGTEQVTQTIADVAAVAQNSSDMASRVKRSAEEQATIADQLQQLVKQFKI